MTLSSTSAGQLWLSFHVFIPDPLEPFLLDCLLPALETEWAVQRVKRFFFIRYSEGGLHLRLRFLPKKGTDAASLDEWLSHLVTEFICRQGITPERCSVQRYLYDRNALYFGETTGSVYAELLNEQTSYLALKLLYSPPEPHGQLILRTACILWILCLRIAKDEHSFSLLIEEYCSFAGEALQRTGAIGSPERSAETMDKLLQTFFHALRLIMRKMPETMVLKRTVLLFRRLSQARSTDSSVAPHALHLFANKMGVSLWDEYHVIACLLRQTLQLNTADTRAYL
jgi:thiopeptide-type bacteriocin biosynthesis protein